MAISNQISRLMSLRDAIRTKLIGLGILPTASTSATLSQCYDALSGVTALGAMSYTPTTTSQVIASGKYLSGAQTINAIPSAYIIPTGTLTISASGTFDVASYASANVTVSGGGGPSTNYGEYINGVHKYTLIPGLNTNFLPAYLFYMDRTAGYNTYLSNMAGDSEYYVKSYVYYSCSFINSASADVQNITFISGNQAFALCMFGKAHEDAYIFSKLSYISGNSNFQSITPHNGTLKFPVLSSISGTHNFAYASLTVRLNLEFPVLSKLTYSSTFYSARHSVSAPSLTTITGPATFQGFLGTLSAPNLANVSATYVFHGAAFTIMDYPHLEQIRGNYVCYDMHSLSCISFANCSLMSGVSAFGKCYNLISVYLLGSSVCGLGNTIASMFGSTPVSTYSTSAGRYASIFVPSSLLADYKAATNWTTISSKIFAYEDYFGPIT